ncbi:4-hydroxybenzoate octaprenyltransferase [Thiomicrorhabdus heinhorstiae]|uniref:4-hydroxybenzoate octaprenyltransferase n=1 Tax=Thiomicrorhabdus heinhorstiae TaxID=2748010 RepID=A0ABS0BYA5_9GAMM|nr:4-hydroxybenzoate octaprenyltransferase [Thiomicrorhabdus heinhorstiae]MBF6058783.1 4-hydroxybenzoate octaprenyltransferase [Thiomicrorhabdus heinhorstiae]
MNAYIRLMRLDRPIGIYLVLWPALWALWFAAKGVPDLWILTVFILGSVIMRSAGCVINDFADRNFDGHVERTCCRPLATGEISAKAGLIFFAFLCLLAFALVLTLNKLTILLSFAAVFLAVLYPFMKRYTHWPQAFLGAAFAWAVPMAFAAILNEVPPAAWLVFAATLIWSLIYDTAYAVGDMPDDLKIGVKSTAILFGEHLRVWIAFFQALMIGLLIWAGTSFVMGWIYYAGLAIAAIWFLYDFKRLGENDPQVAFKVFLQNHWIGVLILVAIAADFQF